MGDQTPPFWVVWNPAGRSPTMRHHTHAAAMAEATRLAQSNPGQEFYVLQPTARIVRSDLTITRFSSDDIPF